MEARNGTEIITCTDVAQWEAWLAAHHERQSGVWLKIAKKDSGNVSITLMEALDIALSYGWIDSQRKAYDAAYYLQRYTPRRSKSPWSKLNVDRVEALMAVGRVRAHGLAEVLAAKADGRWDAAYESQRNASVPLDLATALEKNERARSVFDLLDKTSQYAVILPILKATTPRKRSVRLQKALAQLEAGDDASPRQGRR